jgi:hypothetical protein
LQPTYNTAPKLLSMKANESRRATRYDQIIFELTVCHANNNTYNLCLLFTNLEAKYVPNARRKAKHTPFQLLRRCGLVAKSPDYGTGSEP